MAATNIEVVARFRPLNDLEEKKKSRFVVSFPHANDQEDPAVVSIGGKVYQFDSVLKPDATQEDVYNAAAKNIVKDVLNGCNGTIFAYGQTSSGKTHTMEGVMGDAQLQGIIPRIIQDIFIHIYSMEENLEFLIKVSYLEIYLNKIRDLLDVSKDNLAVHEDKNRVPFVKDATERFVSSPEELFEVIEAGKLNRHVAVTKMNASSSRSHSVFMIQVQQNNMETQRKLFGKLYLVDLAGSEKLSKTGAKGVVLDEAKNINQSLLAFGNVISSLAEGNRSHIPYRNSKLTRILQESLGGKARTTIIICCSPASFNESETRSTLEFGKRAKTIKNMIRVNEELPVEEWKRRYGKEKEKVAKLKAQLEKAEYELQKWRAGESVNFDEQVQIERVLDVFNSSFLSQPSHTAPFPVDCDTHEGAKERRHSYNVQLDEKNGANNQQSQLVEELREKLLEQEELTVLSQRECEILQIEMSRLLAEDEKATEKVKEVLLSLEELALKHDEQTEEVKRQAKENESVHAELTQKKAFLLSVNCELQVLKEAQEHDRKRLNAMLLSLLRDLTDVGDIIGISNATMQSPRDAEEEAEEEFSIARLYISKIKNEVINLRTRCIAQEAGTRVDDREKELGKAVFTVSLQVSTRKTLAAQPSYLTQFKILMQDAIKNVFNRCINFLQIKL